MRDTDSFRLIQAGTALKAIAIAVFLAALYALAGSFDYADALTAEAQAKLDRAAAIRNAAEIAADKSGCCTHPIPWTATVEQSGQGINQVRTRYYVRKDSK
jgi:hypothetical protein